jgi:hypothetical protein
MGVGIFLFSILNPNSVEVREGGEASGGDSGSISSSNLH